MKILAIDPGANFGWALRITKTRVMHGTEDFAKYAGVDGRAHRRFYDWLDDFLYTAKPELIVSEAPIFRGKYSEYLYGFSVIIAMLAFKHRIPTERVHLMTIKKSITGSGKAEKQDMIAAVRALGYNPATEHEADALAILIFKERHSADQQPFTGKAISLKPNLLNTIKRRKRRK
jgi:Holliday junction resolvasome RuvABC endonuclease subunit